MNEITILKNTRPQHDPYSKAFGSLLDRYYWQWAITLTVDHPATKEHMKYKFMEWRSWICMKEHLQIGFAIVVCDNPHSHVHALMLGSNRNGMTLYDVDKNKWKKIWIENSNGMIASRKVKPLSMAANKVENVGSAQAYGAYMATNARANDYDYELSKPRFLKKFSMHPTDQCEEQYS